MKFKLNLLFLLFTLLILLPIVISLDCSIVSNTSCTGVNRIFLYMKNDTSGYDNAHSALINASSGYPYVLCCNSTYENEQINNNCSEIRAISFLKLYNVTNSHAQKTTVDTYDYDVCMQIPKYTLGVNYRSSTCEQNETCLISISSDTNAHVGNCSHYDTQVCVDKAFTNTPPIVTFINLSPSEPDTLTNLNCSFIIEDVDAYDVLYANYSWYKNNTLVPAHSDQISVTNGTLESVSLLASNTEHFEDWYCNVTGYDSYEYGEYNSSNELTIINTPPTMPTQLLPADGNVTLINRYVNFTWTESTDVDGDEIIYVINVTQESKPGLYENTTNLSFINIDEFFTIHETGDKPYFWQIKACDVYGECSNWTTLWNFSIMDVWWVDITNDVVDFGNVSINEEYDTTEEEYTPFAFENLGNIKTDLINITGDSLWSTAIMGNRYLQGKANHSLENPPYNESGTSTDWFNLTNGVYSQILIDEYDYHDGLDLLLFDIRVEVPSAEPPGPKSTTLTFEWTRP